MHVIVIAFCILAVLYYLKYVLSNRKKYEAINRFPGPPTLPILGNILDFGIIKPKIISNLLRLSNEYGPAFRVWLGPTFASLVVTGPKYIEKILVTESITNKGAFYQFASDWLGDSLPVTSGQKWHRGRKFVAPFFNMVNVQKHVPIFNTSANKLIESLKTLDLRNSVQIEDRIISCALENICQTALCMKCDEQSKAQFWGNFRKQCDILVKRAFSMFVRFDVIFRLTKDYQVQRQCMESGTKIVEDMVLTRKKERKNEENTGKPKTLLDFLLDYNEADKNYTLKDIRNEINAILSAGSETVTMALAFCIYEFSRHPDIQRKVSEEVEVVLADDALDADISVENVNKMEYLECVLKEILRMYTPAPIIERTMTEDITLEEGMRIPRGTSVLIFLLGTHRSEKVYPEPDKFNPERFLPENSRDANQCAFVPFSAGARNCLGERYAMIESKIIISKIIRNFEIIAVEEHSPILEHQLVLRSVNGLPIILKPRSRK